MFEAVQHFVQFANIMWMSLIFKTKRLTHIDLFFKNTVKEGILDIKLSKRPPL
jgi:hypothetical protein